MKHTSLTPLTHELLHSFTLSLFHSFTHARTHARTHTQVLLQLMRRFAPIVGRFMRRVGRGRESRKALQRHGRQHVARFSPSRRRGSPSVSPRSPQSKASDAGTCKPLSHPFQVKIVSVCRDLCFAMRQREPGAPQLPEMLEAAAPLFEVSNQTDCGMLSPMSPCACCYLFGPVCLYLRLWLCNVWALFVCVCVCVCLLLG